MISPILGIIDPLTRAESLVKVPKLLLSDVLIIVGVATALGLLLAASIAYFRRRRKHVKGGEKVYRPGSINRVEEDLDTAEDRRRYKRRVRRRDHRARNPTLAETGGLPPARTEQGSDPS